MVTYRVRGRAQGMYRGQIECDHTFLVGHTFALGCLADEAQGSAHSPCLLGYGGIGKVLVAFLASPLLDEVAIVAGGLLTRHVYLSRIAGRNAYEAFML